MSEKIKIFFSVKDYYEELYEAFLLAQSSIFIIGWDLHSKVDLCPHRNNLEPSSKLYNLLSSISRQRPELQIYLLPWEYALIYALERDPLLEVKFEWTLPKNVHFISDGSAPMESSHHQKIVIVDDTVAYCGGVDLTCHRWDDQKHSAKNPYRTLPNGEHYPPYHDIQVRVEGSKVEDFINIAHERWIKVNAKKPEYKKGTINRAILNLPYGKKLDSRSLQVLQTQPESLDNEGLREIEKLCVDLITNSKRYLYIENQYLTSKAITEAIIRRIEKDSSLEILIILPKFAGGWLERETMGRLQFQACSNILSSNNVHKVRIVYPENKELENNEYMTVHSKVMLVDGEHLFISSANLNNRSMGSDSEVGLYSQGDYDSLLAKFLSILSGEKEKFLSKKLESTKSLTQLVDSLIKSGNTRTLKHFDFGKQQFSIPSEYIFDKNIFDHERPARLNQEIYIMEKETKKNWKLIEKIHNNLAVIATIIIAFAFAAIWNYIPSSSAYQEQYKEIIQFLEDSRFSYLISIALFIISGLLFIPINLVILFMATSLSSSEAFLHILAGSPFCVLVTYLIGRFVHYFKFRHKIKQEEGKLTPLLRSASFPMMILMRIIPTVPNSVLGIIAGHCKIPVLKFISSSVIGFVPGTLALIFFQKNLLEIFKDPNPTGLAILAALVCLIFIAYKTMKKRFKTYYG